MIQKQLEVHKNWLSSAIIEANEQARIFENAGWDHSAACSRAMAAAYMIVETRLEKILNEGSVAATPKGEPTEEQYKMWHDAQPE